MNQDRVAPPADTVTLVNKLHEQKGITITHNEVEGADHFFRGRTPLVEDYVRNYARKARS